jgi:hypothetical protein
VTGKEPGKEQKEAYTYSSFHLRKSGIAYQGRPSRRRNPHSTCLWQQRGSHRREGAALEGGPERPRDTGTQERYQEAIDTRKDANCKELTCISDFCVNEVTYHVHARQHADDAGKLDAVKVARPVLLPPSYIIIGSGSLSVRRVEYGKIRKLSLIISV